ncbi:RNP domain protein [Apiospora marii]|uniref:RNP domain protein n=1 Tax=Apiospora marii TaxID=335849 RepID=A0ABR1SH76_9PEZI
MRQSVRPRATLALRPILRSSKKLTARGEARKGRGFGFVTLASEELQQKAVSGSLVTRPGSSPTGSSLHNHMGQLCSVDGGNGKQSACRWVLSFGPESSPQEENSKAGRTGVTPLRPSHTRRLPTVAMDRHDEHQEQSAARAEHFEEGADWMENYANLLHSQDPLGIADQHRNDQNFADQEIVDQRRDDQYIAD